MYPSIPTINPATVVVIAVYKPSASNCISIFPPAFEISKIDKIIPITVPKKPNIGAAPATVASILIFFSNL